MPDPRPRILVARRTQRATRAGGRARPQPRHRAPAGWIARARLGPVVARLRAWRRLPAFARGAHRRRRSPARSYARPPLLSTSIASVRRGWPARPCLQEHVAAKYGRPRCRFDELPPLLGTSHFRVLIGRARARLLRGRPAQLGDRPDAAAGGAVHRFRDGRPAARADAFDRALRLAAEDRRAARTTAATSRSTSSMRRRARSSTRGGSRRAWPCRWSGPAFNAAGNDIAMRGARARLRRPRLGRAGTSPVPQRQGA